ncbi:MAG: AI-2E family transporter [Streptosporangiales bacterium]|nr:AI-2E family transporter [Streptosporangiales bacterium]
MGFTGALGVFVAWALVQSITGARQVLVLIVVSMFLAVGLSPAVEALRRWGLARRWAVSIVFLAVIAFFAGFGYAVVPPLTAQTTAFVSALPDYVRDLQNNDMINRLDQQYQILERAESYLTSGELGQQAFGGVVGAGVVVLSAVFSTVTVLILTLYFLASLPAIKRMAYGLVPRTRRNRVTLLGDEILARIGGYVGGVIVIAGMNGTATFIFLQILGVRYALPLAMVVALFGIIPMIGATLGAVVVTVVGFLTSIPIGIAVVVYYVVYQQVENYIIYPRVMKSSVNVPPTATIIAALVGGALMGVVGALLAIPTAAAIALILREVVVPRQERS